MAEPKTKRTGASVDKFLTEAAGERKPDCEAIAAMMAKVSKAPAEMWGPAIVGFGSYELVSGKTVNPWPRLAFSPRKSDIVLYLVPELLADEARLARLGKVKHGAVCLYIKKLADVDARELSKLIADAWAAMNKKYPPAK